jgi:hypothetical protein
MRTRPITVAPIALAAATAASAGTLRFPPEAELVNVKDYGAVGDGVADDTAAINKAIAENIDKSRYRANRFVYLPNGTYKVTGPIEGRVGGKGTWSAGWRSMMLMMGESREGSVIKLADHAPGYGDPAKPRWVVACGSESDNRDNEGGGGNRAFRHSFVNFTVDVGAGNPGAVAIDFIASNRGCIEDVTLRAAPGSGHTGIAMTRPWPGPAYVGDVTIDGFDVAMRLDHYQYGMTFENLVLRNQRSAGVRNTNNMLAMRKVDFVGNVPFYVAGGGHSFLSLLDSTLKAASPQPVAIQSGGFVNLRRVRFEGFGLAVDDTSKANRDLAGMASMPEGSLAPSGKADSVRPDGTVVSWDLGATFALEGEPRPLDLPIEDCPKPRPGPGDAWTFGGTTRESLQAAIDGGAEWVFVRGVIELDEPLVLRGKLKLLTGLSAHLKGLAGQVALRMDEGDAEAVALEHIYLDGTIEQASGRTFALRHGDLGAFHGSGSGKSHVLDTIGKGYLIGPRHRFWGRQINAEFGDEPLFTNEGTSWILGFKMESSTRGDKQGSQGTPCFLNRGGGRLEVFGGLLYTLGAHAGQRPAVPAFINEKGAIAISYRHNGNPATWYDRILRVGTGADAETIRNDRLGGPGRALLSDRR